MTGVAPESWRDVTIEVRAAVSQRLRALPHFGNGCIIFDEGTVKVEDECLGGAESLFNLSKHGYSLRQAL
jgi:hypothetical protein